MRRPGLWVANGQPKDTQQMLSWQPGAVACFYQHLAANNVFDYKAANPAISVNVRFQHPRDWQQNPSQSAQTLGIFVASKWPEIQPLEPYVYFASRLNTHYENGDPNPRNQHLYTTPDFYQKYANWVRVTADVIKNRVPEMKLITPPFAFGFNEDGSPDDEGNPIKGWAGYDYLQEVVRDYFDNRLTFQAYWGAPARGSVPEWLYDPELASWYAFRWQRVLTLFQARYGLEARVIIDEAGSFGPSDPDFTDQLIYFAEQCLSDPRIISVNYVLWANPANDPLYNLNSWVDHVPDLAAHLQQLKEMPEVRPDTATAIEDEAETEQHYQDDFLDDPFAGSLEGILDEPVPGPPVSTVSPEESAERPGDRAAREAEPEQKIRVLFKDGHVEVMPLETYIRAVVPGEMPALWPMEALKAQAVASRSYAQYAIEHPKFPNADICTTARCQHYAPEKMHPRTDQAVQETRGIIALYNGNTANTLFSAHCGGHTRNNEDVWSGQPVPYLRGVPSPATGPRQGHGVGMCQHGARRLAEQGRTYTEILKHFYQGITLGPN